VTITLQLLHDTDSSAFAATADAWGRLARALDDELDEYVADSRDLPVVWPTGIEAEQRSAVLRARIADTYEPYRQISQALRTHADTVRLCRARCRRSSPKRQRGDHRAPGQALHAASPTTPVAVNAHRHAAPGTGPARFVADVQPGLRVLEIGSGLPPGFRPDPYALLGDPGCGSSTRSAISRNPKPSRR
jgi:hypothetical protein